MLTRQKQRALIDDMKEIKIQFEEVYGRNLYRGINMEPAIGISIADAIIGLTAGLAQFLTALKINGDATEEEIKQAAEGAKASLDEMLGYLLIQTTLDEVEENFRLNSEFDNSNEDK